MVEPEQIERPRFPSARDKPALRWFCALNRLVAFTDLPLFLDSNAGFRLASSGRMSGGDHV